MDEKSVGDFVVSEEKLLDEEAEYVPLITGDDEASDKEGVGSAADGVPASGTAHTAAICLSGGGVRSASFSIGVLQGLAKAKLLEKAGYLSAVSGGNYALSWLTRWRSEVAIGKAWSQDDLRERPENFSSKQEDIDPVRRLRSYSNYLSPTVGLNRDSVTFALSALRKFCFNLIAWLLIFLTIAAIVHAVIAFASFLQNWAMEAKIIELSTQDFEPFILPPFHFQWEFLRSSINDPVISATVLVPLGLLIMMLVSWLVALFFLRKDVIKQETVSRYSAVASLIAGAWFFTFFFFGVIPEFLWDVVSLQEERSNIQFLSTFLGISTIATAIAGLWGNAPQVVRDRAKDITGKFKAFALELVALALLASLAIGSGYFVRSSAVIATDMDVVTPEKVETRQKDTQSSRNTAAEQITEETGEKPDNDIGPKKGEANTSQSVGNQPSGQAQPNEDMLKETPKNSLEEKTNWEILGEKLAALNTAESHKEINDAQKELQKARNDLSAEFAENTEREIEDYASAWFWFALTSFVLGGFAFLFSEFAGANRSSLHSVYGVRLARAFLGTARNDRVPDTSKGHDYQLEDDMLLTDIKFGRWRNPKDPDDPKKVHGEVEGVRKLYPLFPVINMTLNLKGGRGERQDWQERRGAPFIATPLHVGSELLREDDNLLREKEDLLREEQELLNRENSLEIDGLKLLSEDNKRLREVQKKLKKYTPATGYVSTAEMGSNLKDAHMTLGRAMAISGAAASPNMGFYTRPIVAIAMAILNIRLGWWLRNPVKWDPAKQSTEEQLAKKKYSELSTEPFGGIFYLLREAFGILSDKDNWLYLSDGGHFDNLGLYEMIRRRCRQILVIDAGADPKFEYSDLLSTIRKIRVDFGVEIDLPASLPGQEGEGKGQRFVIGRIKYSKLDDENTEDGRLILLKPILLGDEPPGLAQYARTSARGANVFPHQSTVDQFFDEEQFESYRMLGSFSVAQMLSKLDPELFSLAGGDFPFKTPHYPPEPVPPSVSNGETSPGPVAGPQAKDAPPGETSSVTVLANSLASAVQNLPTGELLLRTVGTVAAASITLTVAVDGSDVLTSTIKDAVQSAMPPIDPKSTVEIIVPTINEEGVKTLVAKLDKLQTQLQKIQGNTNPDRVRGENEKIYLTELRRLESELGKIKTGIDNLIGKNDQNGNGGGSDEANIARIGALEASQEKQDIDIGRLETAQNGYDGRLIGVESGQRGQSAALDDLENSGSRVSTDINALQGQIDFLRRRLADITRSEG